MSKPKAKKKHKLKTFHVKWDVCQVAEVKAKNEADAIDKAMRLNHDQLYEDSYRNMEAEEVTQDEG